MMFKINFRFLLSLFIVLVLVACKSNVKKVIYTDTSTSGEISIAADESCSLLVDAEANAFQSAYKDAKLNIRYTSEVDAFRLLLADSVRMIVVSRKLSEEEKKNIIATRITPDEVKVARDAIAFIVNKDNPLKQLTQKNVKEILSGKITKWNDLGGNGEIKVVFDNKNSSIVRYCRDSILKGGTLFEKSYAMNDNPAVIKFVESDKNAIGIIGAGWISDSDDPSTQEFFNSIKVLSIMDAYEEKAFKPYQAYLATGEYPYYRDIVMISKEPHTGLATGFMNYTRSDIGQTIVLKLGLLPISMPVRLVSLTNELN
ncbi:MAG: substrate-binding domain-containing protein [Bacteroidetes bacterium]|nr:substrate-binding domain-containing protein [Bacteroidota bacterium]